MIKTSGFNCCGGSYASQPQFSSNTLKYLSCFQGTLDKMIREMSGAQLTDSISHNFITQMIPHHQAAIEMSRNLLQYTTLIPLQDIALGIISEQTKSIENMKEILCKCSDSLNTAQDLKQYQMNFKEITGVMFSGMKNAAMSNSINVSFMNEMIPHHKGAVEMSQSALCFPICSGLKPILNAIIVSQKKGIQQMETLLYDINKCVQC